MGFVSFCRLITENNDILILAQDPTQGLDVTLLTVKDEYSIDFTKQRNEFFLVYSTMEAIVIYLSIYQFIYPSTSSKQNYFKILN